jgi:hypothetical protein
MAINIIVNGFEVSVSDPTEAAALLGALKKAGETAAINSKPAEAPALPPTAVNGSSSSAELADINTGTAQMALRFLKAIRDGGASGGIQSDAVMTALGVTVAKAIGSKSAAINTLIKDGLGMRPKSAYVNPKTKEGRFWKPGRQIGNAIQQLEQRLAAH